MITWNEKKGAGCAYGCEQFADRDSRCEACNAKAEKASAKTTPAPRAARLEGRR